MCAYVYKNGPHEKKFSLEITLNSLLECRISEYLSKCTSPRPVGKDVLAVQTGSSQVMEDLSLTNLHISHKKVVTLESPYTIPAFTADPTVCICVILLCRKWALCICSLHG